MTGRLPGLTYRTWDALFGDQPTRCQECHTAIARNSIFGKVVCNACFDVLVEQKILELHNSAAGNTQK